MQPVLGAALIQPAFGAALMHPSFAAAPAEFAATQLCQTLSWVIALINFSIMNLRGVTYGVVITRNVASSDGKVAAKWVSSNGKNPWWQSGHAARGSEPFSDRTGAGRGPHEAAASRFHEGSGGPKAA